MVEDVWRIQLPLVFVKKDTLVPTAKITCAIQVPVLIEEFALWKKALDISDGRSSALVHMGLKENYVIFRTRAWILSV